MKKTPKIGVFYLKSTKLSNSLLCNTFYYFRKKFIIDTGGKNVLK